MVFASNTSKYAVDPHLFKPEPPVEPRQVKELFHGREQELCRGVESLKAGLDIGGKRSKRLGKSPWVIHGESRSGKSHLARRIFAQFPDSDRRIQLRIPAGNRLDALLVLRELFEEMRQRFLTRVYDQRLAHDPLSHPEVQLVRQLVEKVGLFEPGAQTATLTVEQSSRESAGAGLEIGGGTLLAKFVAKFQSERAEKATVRVTLRPPTPSDLAELCGIMAETLLRQKLIRHVLVLLDDVDLLESYVSPQQNARTQRSLLADAVRILHNAPGVDVVLTARSWYAHSNKELQTLVDLAKADPMPVEEMLGIYDRRSRVYGAKRRPAEFLTREALQQLAGDVDGLPGVFLQHLQTAFYQFQNEEDTRPRDYGWLMAFFRRHFEFVKEKCAAGYHAIEQAVRDGSKTIDVTERNLFFGTLLENEYAYQSYYSETTYFISPLVRKLLSSNLEVRA